MGITALKLDTMGVNTEVTSVYHSRLLAPTRRATIAGASIGR